VFWLRHMVALLPLFLVGAAPASARNAVVNLPIANVLSSPDAQDKLGHSIQLYFGAQPTPPVAKEFGHYVSHRKTNGFAKSEETSCDWAFLSALVELQERAVALGANAVVNIESYYNRHEVASADTYECHKGFLMAGVVLRGTMVRLSGR
jgi:uncharacterized protein YbjQ (UPF0145 family)